MGVLKSGFNSDIGFPYEPPSHIVYKVLHANSFCGLSFYHHYDHCIANIVTLCYIQTWSLYIIKRIYCLFACLCGSRYKEYTDNSKPIFLVL